MIMKIYDNSDADCIHIHMCQGYVHMQTPLHTHTHTRIHTHTHTHTHLSAGTKPWGTDDNLILGRVQKPVKTIGCNYVHPPAQCSWFGVLGDIHT